MAHPHEAPELDIFSATMIAEGEFELAGVDPEDVDEDLIISAWQKLIDTGVCWRLQGWFGRTAADLIAAGHCQPAA